MENQQQNTRYDEVMNMFREINNDARKAKQVNWLPALLEIKTLNTEQSIPLDHVEWMWAFLTEIHDPTTRMTILSQWQYLAPQCFDTQEERDDFIEQCACIYRICLRIKGLYNHNDFKMPQTYDAEVGSSLNELVAFWSDKYVQGADLVALATEVHNTLDSGKQAIFPSLFLLSSRNYNHLAFDNIYDFCRCLMMVEGIRKTLTEGKSLTSELVEYVDFKRSLRKACFDEYIRLQIDRIKEEMENDNSLIDDPKEKDYYLRLREDEKIVVDRELMYENFRGSQAYQDRWFVTRPSVLKMIQTFMDYLDIIIKEERWKDKTQLTAQNIYIQDNHGPIFTTD